MVQADLALELVGLAGLGVFVADVAPHCIPQIQLALDLVAPAVARCSTSNLHNLKSQDSAGYGIKDAISVSAERH